MVLSNHGGKDANDHAGKLARIRLVGDLSNGRCRTGESMRLAEIAAQHQLDEDSVLKVFAEFQTLGMVTLSGSVSAIFHSPNPKGTQEAYEIRAALEEIGGRAAARTLKGNTAGLQRELDAMRTALRSLDLDSFVEHDVAFHRCILEASQNEVLLRVWDSLAVDLRIRGGIANVSKEFPEAAESHQPIIDALEKGRGREAGLLLRNHIETVLEFLKKSDSDSGFHKALHRDLENAKNVQEASFPRGNVAIPGLCCETFYKPVQSIGGDYYDFLPLQADRWGIAIGDVCGKGIGAALLVAGLQGSLRAQARHAYSDLSELIADIDRLVRAASPEHLYASLFYAEYDVGTRALRYVNAGHNAPMVLRWKQGRCEVFHLESSGTPLGLLEVSHFTSKSFQLEVGDVFVGYTDGITETQSPGDELWGKQQLESLLRSCCDRTPAQIIRRILDEVRTFANGRPQRDDVTLVIASVNNGDAR
jgi:DNA-binding GntR family transcriptional regulator